MLAQQSNKITKRSTVNNQVFKFHLQNAGFFPNGGQLGSHGGMHMMTAAGNYASMPPGSPEQSNSTSPGIGGGGGGPSGNPGNLLMGFDNKIVRRLEFSSTRNF